MSILEKLRILNTPKLRLFDLHPLASQDLDFRLQYLAAVAMLTAVEREPTEAELRSFIDLGTALGVDLPDAQEQLVERASLSVDDMAVLLDAIRQKQAAWVYLLDVAWMHAADGELEPNEITAGAEIASLMAAHLEAARLACRFVLALRTRSQDLFALVPAMFAVEALVPLLPALLAPWFPFVTLVAGRWIDHGNGLTTDCENGVMWLRYFVGQRWEGGKAQGDAIKFDPDREQVSVDQVINEVNFNKKLGGFGDWRIPENEIFSVFKWKDDSYAWVKDRHKGGDNAFFVYFQNYPFQIFSDIFKKTLIGVIHKKVLHWVKLKEGGYTTPCVLLLCRNALPA